MLEDVDEDGEGKGAEAGLSVFSKGTAFFVFKNSILIWGVVVEVF